LITLVSYATPGVMALQEQQLTRNKGKRDRTKVNAHPIRMNDHEGYSERPYFGLGTRMITRDIHDEPNGTNLMKATLRKTKTIPTLR
jgi:hypothetical protein